MPSTTSRIVGVLAVMALLLISQVASAQHTPHEEEEEDLFIIGGGVFDVTRDKDSAEGRLVYAPGARVLGRGPYFRGIGPLIGIMANSDGGVFGFGGFFFDIRLSDHVTLRPELGLGAYGEGDSKDLGGTFEFHTALDLAYRFDNDHRLGVQFAHISNAGIHDDNPGANSLLVTYAIPIGRLF